MFFEMVINKYVSTDLQHTCVNTYRSDSAQLIKLLASGHPSASDDVLFSFLPKTSACAFQTPIKESGNIFNLVQK